jgi:hypothetical protein
MTSLDSMDHAYYYVHFYTPYAFFLDRVLLYIVRNITIVWPRGFYPQVYSHGFGFDRSYFYKNQGTYLCVGWPATLPVSFN